METNNKTNNITNNEKVSIIRNTFHHKYVDNTESSQEFIKNVGDYLVKNFSKIDGFDFRWNSLITNNPLLFEDVNYFRVKPYVENIVTESELEAYKSGQLRELYHTFDSLLICNLKYYDRIMNYCTMVFLRYITINGRIIKPDEGKFEKIVSELSLTPTKIWCAVLSNHNSSKWEIEYGWDTKLQLNPIPTSNISYLELNWKYLYRNVTFAKFNELNAFRCGTNGFRETFINDVTPNSKLADVCSKFTRTSVAISDNQLKNLYSYILEVDEIKIKLFTILYDCMLTAFNHDKSKFAIYIFNDEFFIFSNKFSLKVSKNERGQITKDYLANSYECFVAEEYLIPSIRMQIEWSKYKLPMIFEYDKKILKNFLTNMLEFNYRDILCIKRIDNQIDTYSKITFTGIFNNVKIVEEFVVDNRIIKVISKTLSKRNAANYIVERGYYLFGTEIDMMKLSSLNKTSLVRHYSNYCIPIIQHMSDIIEINKKSRDEIVSVLLNGLSDNRLNNDNIKYTFLSEINERDILAKGLQLQNNFLMNNKGYWKAILE